MRKIITVMLLALLLVLVVPAQAEFLYPATAAEVPLPPIPLEKLPVVTACDVAEDGRLTAHLDMPYDWDELIAGLPEATVQFCVEWRDRGKDWQIDLDLEDGVATGYDPHLEQYKTYPILLCVETADDSFCIDLPMRTAYAYSQCSWRSKATGGDTYTVTYDDAYNLTGFSFTRVGKHYYTIMPTGTASESYIGTLSAIRAK